MLLAGPDRGYLTAYVLEYLDHGTPTIQGPLQLYSYARDGDHWQCGLSPIELTERVPGSTLHYKFTHLLSRAAEYMRTGGLSTLGRVLVGPTHASEEHCYGGGNSSYLRTID